jgi:GNAT superfamily N-acetyltransferase
MIREMLKTDLPALRTLYNESRRASFFWEKADYSIVDFDEATRDELVLVITKAEKILGFVSIYLPENFVHNLFVDPKAGRQQAGTQLLTAALSVVKRPARLKVVSKNKMALNFYEKNKWIKVCEKVNVKEPYWLMEYQVDIKK